MRLLLVILFSSPYLRRCRRTVSGEATAWTTAGGVGKTRQSTTMGALDSLVAAARGAAATKPPMGSLASCPCPRPHTRSRLPLTTGSAHRRASA